MPHVSEYQCCDAANLWVSDEQMICWQHASDAHLRRLGAVEAEASTLGLDGLKHRSAWHTDFAWPLGPFNHLEGRELLVEWALENELKLSKRVTVCFHALLFGRCSTGECVAHGDRLGVPLLNEAGGYDLDPSWLDHLSLWERGGRPVVLVNQPYLGMPTALEFLQLGEGSSLLRVEVRKESWYRQGTCFIGVWLDEPLTLVDSTPLCRECGTGRSGFWYVNKSRLDWRCRKCDFADTASSDREWRRGTRAELRKWRSLAVALRGVDPSAQTTTENKEQ